MKNKRKKMIKNEIKEKLFDFKKQTKIFYNLRELHKFTRLQTRRVGAFKERSASIQHKLCTGRNNGYVFDLEGDSLFKDPRDKHLISDRKLSSLYPNEIKEHLRRTKKLMRSVQESSFGHTKTIDRFSPKRKRSNKRRQNRGLRPKSAPGLRKICQINKGRRGTVDAERLVSYQNKRAIDHHNLRNNKSFTDAQKSNSPPNKGKKCKSKKKRSGKKKQNGKIKRKSESHMEFRPRIPKILNFKFKHQEDEIFLITEREAQAAFYIFMVWKLK